MMRSPFSQSVPGCNWFGWVEAAICPLELNMNRQPIAITTMINIGVFMKGIVSGSCGFRKVETDQRRVSVIKTTSLVKLPLA